MSANSIKGEMMALCICGVLTSGVRDPNPRCPLHPPPAVPRLDDDIERLVSEMTAQAELGNMRFCLGTHEHEGGELEYEWIDWSDAFGKLRLRIRTLIDEQVEAGINAFLEPNDQRYPSGR